MIPAFRSKATRVRKWVPLALVWVLFSGSAFAEVSTHRPDPVRDRIEPTAAQLCTSGQQSNLACGNPDGEGLRALGDYRESNFNRKRECENNLHAGNDYTPQDPLEVRTLNGSRARYTSACLGTYAKMEEITEAYYEKRRNGCRTIQSDLRRAQQCACGPVANQRACLAEAREIYQRVSRFEQEMIEELAKANREVDRLMDRNRRAVEQYNQDRNDLANPEVIKNRQRVNQLLTRGYADSIQQYREYIDRQVGEQERAQSTAEALRNQIQTVTEEHRRNIIQYNSMATNLGAGSNPANDMSTVTGNPQSGEGVRLGQMAPLMGPAMAGIAAAQRGASGGSDIGGTGSSRLGAEFLPGGSGGGSESKVAPPAQRIQGGLRPDGPGTKGGVLPFGSPAQVPLLGSAVEGLNSNKGSELKRGEGTIRGPASAFFEGSEAVSGSSHPPFGASSHSNGKKTEQETAEELKSAKSFSTADLGVQSDLANGDLTSAMNSLAEELGADLTDGSGEEATAGMLPDLLAEGLSNQSLSGSFDNISSSRQSGRVIQGEEGEPLFDRIRAAHVRSAKRGLLVLGHRNKLK